LDNSFKYQKNVVIGKANNTHLTEDWVYPKG
jgi:hypothetical protein